MAYLDITGFKALSTMSSAEIDELEAIAPGWLAAKLAARSRWLDARLRKRYAVPFSPPYPEAVQDWLARLVTYQAYLRRGVDPTDAQFAEIKADAERAEAEVQEAAEAQNGLFDLPLRADSSASGISKGAPYIYSEKSPTVWTHTQSRRGREERRNGRGTDG